MAKKRLQIAPKLKNNKSEKKALPVQNISVEAIEQIATGKKTTAPKRRKPVTNKTKTQKADKKPQGRPRRTEQVKRLSSDLPADLYDKMKEEIKANGYTMNGFLAKLLRDYFANK